MQAVTLFYLPEGTVGSSDSDAVDGSSTWHLSAKESGAVGMSSMWPRERVEGDGRVGDC